MDNVLEALSASGNLSKACRETGVDKATFLRWCDAEQTNANRYVRAREAGLDAEADKGMEEATNWTGDASLGRLALDARKWYLSKLMPKKYGEKTLLGSDPENPLPAAGLNVSGLSEATLRELAAQGGEKK